MVPPWTRLAQRRIQPTTPLSSRAFERSGTSNDRPKYPL
jgi:hypothetical protein